MPYTPDWESLSSAVTRIKASGVEEGQAREDLCHAIADRKVAVRVTLVKSKQIFLGGNVRPPAHLKPNDLDWEHSRPSAPWWIGPVLGEHYFWDGGQKDIEFVEVSIAEVIEVLLGNERDLAANTVEHLSTSHDPLTHSEVSRVAGKKSGETRRANRPWVPHATELAVDAYDSNPSASNATIADYISDAWKHESPQAPGHRTLSEFVSEMRIKGDLPQRTGSLPKRTGSGC